MQRIKRHLTYGNIMATLACFLAVAGTSYAAVQLSANSIRSGHIVDGTIRAQDLARGSITTSKVRDGSLQARDFAAGVLSVPGASNSTTNVTNVSGIPTNGIVFFLSPSCPDGWTEYVTARGRYVVGVRPDGDIGGTRGASLANLENRSVGRHDHGTEAHTHTHPTGMLGGGTFKAMADAATGTEVLTPGPAMSIGSTTVNVLHRGDEFGTNAPYVQLLACRKA